jgi:NhaA family Na+:H+ antiporter
MTVRKPDNSESPDVEALDSIEEKIELVLEEFQRFLKLESSSGIILFIAAVVAMVLANSPLDSFYNLLVEMPVELRIGALHIAKPALLWINDGLMAVFFFLVGLELKRELMEGELNDPRTIALPAFGAVGGMLAPALIYAWFNWGDAVALQGWAIPAATDIAFALGILYLLGDRVPDSLKVFLVSLAIFDDLGAIIIIAIFYTENLSLSSLGVAGGCIGILFVLNRRKVVSFTPYVLIGLVMWVAMLKSGVHATLAGVVLAVFIPMRAPGRPDYSPVRELEHDLHTAVAYAILPIFAFANAGISLRGIGMDYLLHPVPIGIAAGLFIGKQIGVMGLCWLGVRLGVASLPQGVNWRALYGISMLCGVGFTMSLFIGSLAFEQTGSNLLFDERVGIIAGSLISGVAGYFWLQRVLPKNQA